MQTISKFLAINTKTYKADIVKFSSDMYVFLTADGGDADMNAVSEKNFTKVVEDYVAQNSVTSGGTLRQHQS